MSKATSEINTYLDQGWALRKGHPEVHVISQGAVILVAVLYKSDGNEPTNHTTE
jgi:hypothetical protein